MSEATYKLLPDEQWEPTGGVEVKGKVRVACSFESGLCAAVFLPLVSVSRVERVGVSLKHCAHFVFVCVVWQWMHFLYSEPDSASCN